MKKLASIVLAMLLVLTSASFVCAAETVVVDTTVDIQVYTLNVTVRASVAGTKTLKIYPLTLNEETEEYEIVNPLAPVYLGEQKLSDTENGVYIYEFAPFNFLPTQSTGKYRAVVNGKYNTDFTFVNKQDKIDVYNALATANASTIGAILKNGYEAGKIDLDLEEYLTYEGAVKAKIDAQLAAVELPALGADPTDAQLEAFEAVFKPALAQTVAIANLITSASKTVEDFDAAVQENAETLGLDLIYYNNNKLDIKAQVAKRLAALNVNDFALETVTNAFDTAVLLAMLDQADYGIVTEGLQHYNGGCITLDAGAASNFTKAEINRISIGMKEDAKKGRLNSAEDIEDSYVDNAEEIANGQGSTGTGGGGGGGGGSTGGGSASRPGTTHSGQGSSNVDVSAGEETVVVNFSDLGEAPWAKDAIEYLASKGVLTGKGDGRFYPNETVTREQFVKIIVEAFGLYNKNAVVTFDDVAADRWSYGYIASAYRAGIITGVSDTEFNPEGNITRQDMAVIMYRLADLLGAELNGSASFADEAAIADYAKPAVKALAGAGIINGTGNNCFSPLDTVTRAQAAKVAYELLIATGGAN